MDLEALIKEKEYIELTVQERELVEELASNEDAYNDLKSFLHSTEKAFAEDQIIASDRLQEAVMSELYAPITSKKTWFSSFFSFFFPKDRPILRQPVFQLSLVAALFIGFFFLIDSPFKKEELAINTISNEVKKEEIEQPVIEEKRVEPKESLERSTNQIEPVEVIEDLKKRKFLMLQ